MLTEAQGSLCVCICVYDCLLKIFCEDVYGAGGSQVSIVLKAGPLLLVLLILRSEILQQIIQICSSKPYPYVVSLKV